MSEVEKMMQNAGVKKVIIPCPAKYYGYDCTRNNWDDEDCSCDIEGYPPFTAEKQISLIIFLSYRYSKGLLFNVKAMDKDIDIYDFELFGECLAKLVNELWQDLTEAEKEGISGILRT